MDNPALNIQEFGIGAACSCTARRDEVFTIKVVNTKYRLGLFQPSHENSILLRIKKKNISHKIILSILNPGCREFIFNFSNRVDDQKILGTTDL